MIGIAKNKGISIADEKKVRQIVQQYKLYFAYDNNVHPSMIANRISFECNLSNYDKPTRYWSAIALCRALPQKIPTISAHFEIADKILKNIKNMTKTIGSCHGMVPEDYDSVVKVWKQTRQRITTSTPVVPLVPVIPNVPNVPDIPTKQKKSKKHMKQEETREMSNYLQRAINE